MGIDSYSSIKPIAIPARERRFRCVKRQATIISFSRVIVQCVPVYFVGTIQTVFIRSGDNPALNVAQVAHSRSSQSVVHTARTHPDPSPLHGAGQAIQVAPFQYSPTEQVRHVAQSFALVSVGTFPLAGAWC